MKNTIGRYARIGYALVVGIVINHCQPVLAGWNGAMNGTGYGKASVNVVSSQEASRTVASINMTNPSVAMTINTAYAYSALLPKDSSPATTAKVKGFPGYVWQATTVGSNGDSTDSTEFEGVQINPADCASLEMASSSVIAPDDKSGTITVNATATAGTALRVRGYEALGALPEDDLSTTNVDETLKFLKEHGALKWDITLLGPFNLNKTTCNALVIPFTIETGTSNLYFITDGVAKSLPLIINCPNDKVVKCEDSFSYDPVTFAGCGNVTISYNPPAPAGGMFPPRSFPVGVTPVTVTATDKDGNTTNCTFTVTVTDSTPPVITATGTPATGVLGFNPTPPQIQAALGTATATDNCGPVTPTAQTGSVSVNGCSRSQTRTWTLTDTGGNAATPVSRMVTWTVDTTPPVVPLLATVTGACGANVTLPVPTVATDNCGGTVTVTPNVAQVFSTPGTNVVKWTFTDGAGNSSFAYQTGIVAGLTFKGFYSPVGTVSNLCTSPVIANQGSVTPIKFDMLCGTSYVTTGQPPTVIIQPVDNNCNLTGTPVTVNAEYQNDWHYNWDTSGWAKNKTYKVTVVLPGGTTRYVFIRLK